VSSCAWYFSFSSLKAYRLNVKTIALCQYSALILIKELVFISKNEMRISD